MSIPVPYPEHPGPLPPEHPGPLPRASLLQDQSGLPSADGIRPGMLLGCVGRVYIPSETPLASPISDAAIDETQYCHAEIQTHHFTNISTKASHLFHSRAMIMVEIWKQHAAGLAHANHPLDFQRSGAGRVMCWAGCHQCRGAGVPSPSPHRARCRHPPQLPSNNQGPGLAGSRGAALAMGLSQGAVPLRHSIIAP